jgi:hypothetical protein
MEIYAPIQVVGEKHAGQSYLLVYVYEVIRIVMHGLHLQ